MQNNYLFVQTTRKNSRAFKEREYIHLKITIQLPMLCNGHLTHGVVAIEIIANFVFRLIKYHSIVRMNNDELSISIDFLKNNNIIPGGHTWRVLSHRLMQWKWKDGYKLLYKILLEQATIWVILLLLSQNVTSKEAYILGERTHALF